MAGGAKKKTREKKAKPLNYWPGALGAINVVDAPTQTRCSISLPTAAESVSAFYIHCIKCTSDTETICAKLFINIHTHTDTHIHFLCADINCSENSEPRGCAEIYRNTVHTVSRGQFGECNSTHMLVLEGSVNCSNLTIIYEYTHIILYNR